MALLYKIDNSIYIEDLNSNKFHIALNGALFKFDNQSQVYTIFNQFTGVTVKIKVSDIPSYTNDLAVAYSEASLLAFLRLYTGAVSGGGSSVVNVYNDFTDAYETKLNGIEAGAEVNVQSDWSETNPASDAFIKNKPAITPPISLHSGLTLDDGTNPHGTTKTDVGLSNVPNVDTSTTANISDITAKRFVSDTEKTAIKHSNRSILDLITESFTTALKTAYDSTITWISINGANVLSHLSSTSNPHGVTASQVGNPGSSPVAFTKLLGL